MTENGIPPPDNSSTSTTSNTIYHHIDDFLIYPGLGCDVDEKVSYHVTTMLAKITPMASGTFVVTDNLFSYGAGGTAQVDGSHRSTSKTPSYTKSINWSHYPTYGI